MRVGAGTGVYATASCTSAGGEGKFEWIAGPGPKAGFSLGLKPGTGFVLEGQRKVICSGVGGSGEVTGPASIGNLTITLTGCEVASGKCNTAGQGEGQIVLAAMTGNLGVVKAGATALQNQVGLTLAGEATFGCGRGSAETQVQGSAIGVITATHSMTTSRKWNFRVASKARQTPERFEGGVPQLFEWSISGSALQRVGLYLPATLTSEEKIEINTVI